MGNDNTSIIYFQVWINDPLIFQLQECKLHLIIWSIKEKGQIWWQNGQQEKSEVVINFPNSWFLYFSMDFDLRICLRLPTSVSQGMVWISWLEANWGNFIWIFPILSFIVRKDLILFKICLFFGIFWSNNLPENVQECFLGHDWYF